MMMGKVSGMPASSSSATTTITSTSSSSSSSSSSSDHQGALLRRRRRPGGASMKSSCGAKLELFKYKDLEAATGGFAEENLIAKSHHGVELYEARLHDGRLVMVKKPPPRRSLQWQDVEEEACDAAFENEVDVLTKVFSRRLVNLLGYCQEYTHGAAGKIKLLVLEFMENTSLHSQLHGGGRRRGADGAVAVAGSASSSCCSSTTLSWPLRVHLALQTAKALRALHSSSPPLVHRDVRAMNVFIDRNWNARLGEFGLARHVQDQALTLSSTTENAVAAAASCTPARKSNLSSIPEISEPESSTDHGAEDSEYYCRSVATTRTTAAAAAADLALDDVNPETDVWSFGVLLLELMSGRDATSLNADCSVSALVEWALPLIKQGNAFAICDPRIKLPLCATALKHVAAIAARCLRPPPTATSTITSSSSTISTSSSSRLQQLQPTMSEVVEVLTKVSKLIPLPLWNGQTTRVQYIPSSSSSPSSSIGLHHHHHHQHQHAADQPSCFVLGLHLDTHAMNCRIGRLIRLPMWLGFLQTKLTTAKSSSSSSTSKTNSTSKSTTKSSTTKQSFVAGLGKSVSLAFSKKLGLVSKTGIQLANKKKKLKKKKTAAARVIKRAKVSDDDDGDQVGREEQQQRPGKLLPAAATTVPAAADFVSNRKALEANMNSQSLTIARHHHHHHHHHPQRGSQSCRKQQQQQQGGIL